LVIPALIEGKSVTPHRGWGLLAMHQPDEHHDPDSVTSIGTAAFNACTGPRKEILSNQ
jgi:hypothetical protein